MKRVVILSIISYLSIISFANAAVFDNGGYHPIAYTINEDVWVDQSVSNNPGTHIELVTGGWAKEDIWAYNYSTITVTGGQIDGELRAYNDVTLNINGGTIYDVMGFGNCNITLSDGTIGNDFSIGGDTGIALISGGTIVGNLNLYDYGIINLDGSNFFADGAALNYGDNVRDYATVGIDPWGNSCLTATVTGSLSNGSFLNNVVYIHDDADMYVIPEPATLLLFGLGVAILRKRK